MKLKIAILFIIPGLFLQAQDTTRSEAFKKPPFSGRVHVFTPKYQSYPLVAGYILTKEANSGDPFAQHELGLRYLMGRGFQADTAKAVYWIQKAASQRLATAEFNLGIMLLNGIGAPWNPFEAYRYFEKAAKAGMPEAAYLYAVINTDNLVVNRNLNEAYRWASYAAEKGMKAAERLKERLEEYGIKERKEKLKSEDFAPDQSFGNNSNELIASNWEADFINFEDDSLFASKEKNVVEKLLTKKSKDLRRYIGFIDSTEAKNKNSNLEIIKSAAKNGSPEALTLLGKSYEFGINQKKDTILAAFNYLRALRMGARKPVTTLIEFTKKKSFFDKLKGKIDSGNSDAMYVWAAITAFGFDYQLADQQALDLLLKASGKGHIPSLIESGMVYLTGSMVEKDTSKALEYWTKAEELGSSEAVVRKLFLSISKEKENFHNPDKIAELKRLANTGSVLAESVLAFCYENGFGIKMDKARASELYRDAANRGSEAAYAALKKMYDDIRPDNEIFQIYEN